MRAGLIALGVTWLAGLPLIKAQTYDPAADFSAVSNPSGVWSYGYSNSLGQPLILHSSSDLVYGFPTWRTDISKGDPIVGYNPTAAEIAFGTFTVGPHEFVLHPGPNNQPAILRFTAPGSGSYRVTGTFRGRDTHGTTSDVHVRANSASIFDGLVSGYGPGTGPTFDVTATVAAGAPIDIAVGFGNNGGFDFDSTGFTGRITVVVPEPSALTLLMASGLLAIRRARRRLRGYPSVTER